MNSYLEETNIQTPSSTVIAPVVYRTITGYCSTPANMDWSRNGLVAYSCNSVVVIVDPTTLQYVQCLDQHRFPITKIRWWNSDMLSPIKDLTSVDDLGINDVTTLASSDTAGVIFIWNIKRSEVVRKLTSGDKQEIVQDIQWVRTSESCLLVSLQTPAILTLWNTLLGQPLWRKVYCETSLLAFDVDPFNSNCMVFRCIESYILLIYDFNPYQAPVGDGVKLYVKYKHQNNKCNLDRSVGKNSSTIKIKRIMKDFGLGESTDFGVDEADTISFSNCTDVQFHRSTPRHLVLVFVHQILLLDLDVGIIVGGIGFDSIATSPIFCVRLGRLRDTMFLLHENGNISVRIRRQFYSNTTSSIGQCINGRSDLSDFLEISYETRINSDAVRLNKNAKILGAALNPINELEMCVFTSEGHIYVVYLRPATEQLHPNSTIEDLLPTTQIVLDPLTQYNIAPAILKLRTGGLLSGLAAPPLVVRMCPFPTVKNIREYMPYLAVGSATGNIQICNVYTGYVERDFAIHTFAVRGIEWTSNHNILSFGHQTLGSGFLVKNEFFYIDIRTGNCKPLRLNTSESSSNHSFEVDEPAILSVKVSYLKQYFIVMFNEAPFELWDLKTFRLLRRMSRKFPLITALEWSSRHSLKSTKHKQMLEQKEKFDAEKELGQVSHSSSSDITVLPLSTEEVGDSLSEAVAKEHFIFTSYSGRLYHFSVEENTIKSRTNIQTDMNIGAVVAIAWKKDTIVSGDLEGNVGVWDVKQNVCRALGSSRNSPIKLLRFAPGRHNFKMLVLHTDTIRTWDIERQELISELKFNTFDKIVDADWATSDRIILVSLDGMIRIMDFGFNLATSFVGDYQLKSNCPGLFLSRKTCQNAYIVFSHRPWLTLTSDDHQLIDVSDGFEVDEVQQLIQLMSGLSPISMAARCYLVSNNMARLGMQGSEWTSDFWQLARFALKEIPDLDTRFDTFQSSVGYKAYQIQRLNFHRLTYAFHNRPLVTKKDLGSVADFLICLDQTSDAIRLLLADNYTDNLRACLVSVCASASPGDRESTVVKLVATNLIADGKMWEGVQLLCLIGKVFDACQYLQSMGNAWEASLWLAKCRLSGSELDLIVGRYADYLVSRNQYEKAILLRLSHGHIAATLNLLVAREMWLLAAQFVAAFREHFIDDAFSHVIDTVHIALSKLLISLGNSIGAFYYCDLVVDCQRGKLLKAELNEKIKY